MRRLGDVLDLDLPIGDVEDTAKVAKLWLSAGQTVLNTQVRVDEARLKRQNVDIIPEIAKILAEEKARLAALRTVEASR